jgi:hypothetical protein
VRQPCPDTRRAGSAGWPYSCAHPAMAPSKGHLRSSESEHGLDQLSQVRASDTRLPLGGHRDGLNRHDGHSFRRTRPRRRIQTAPSHVAGVLSRTVEGRLWVGGYAGLARYDPDRTRRPLSPRSGGQARRQVRAILEERDGRLVATEKGAALDPEGGVSRTLVPTPSQGGALRHLRPRAIGTETPGRATGAGPVRHRCALEQSSRGSAGRPTGLEARRVEALFRTRRHASAVRRRGRLPPRLRGSAHHAPLPQPNEPASLGTARVRRIAADRPGDLIGTENGGPSCSIPTAGFHLTASSRGRGPRLEPIYALTAIARTSSGSAPATTASTTCRSRAAVRACDGGPGLSDSHVTAIVKTARRPLGHGRRSLNRTTPGRAASPTTGTAPRT